MDTREDILQRLVAIAETIPGLNVYRNVLKIPDARLPALSILDGDEVSNPNDIPTAGQPNTRFARMTMMPEIVIKVSDSSADVGSALNALRIALIKAVLSDADLAALHGVSGRVWPTGLSTQLAYGRAMTGEMAVAFGITYRLLPDQL